MDLEPWMRQVMDEAEGTFNRDEELERVGEYFIQHDKRTFFYNEFVTACRNCDINPSNFSLRDVEALRKKLKEEQ